MRVSRCRESGRRPEGDYVRRDRQARRLPDHPYILMYSMLCACGAAFFCLVIVTWLKLLVSSTHRICGGAMGFALVYGVAGSENWADSQADFPFAMGGAPIIASCFLSPLLTGVVVAAIFGTIRSFVLRPANAVQRAMRTLTIVVAHRFSLLVCCFCSLRRRDWSPAFGYEPCGVCVRVDRRCCRACFLDAWCPTAEAAWRAEGTPCGGSRTEAGLRHTQC
ncbi:hypothetical protein LSCM4_06076 [Leishmania orientalis]|uniref:Uncharacterized protein n=1 Tax=Leishmania orientalis TaxID=2249476 RepID=A0A836HP09_9TRYP|nr:hypothetical protein LSCM4_06076 [Leishmania orientalis]